MESFIIKADMFPSPASTRRARSSVAVSANVRRGRLALGSFCVPTGSALAVGRHGQCGQRNLHLHLRAYSNQDFRFGPGTATVYIRAGPNARLFALTLHISSAGRRQGSSVRSQTLIARPERRCGRHYSLPNLFGAENC